MENMSDVRLAGRIAMNCAPSPLFSQRLAGSRFSTRKNERRRHTFGTLLNAAARTPKLCRNC